MANFLLVYFPIDKVFTVERASDFNLHEGDISIGLNVKREFLTTVFHDGGRSNERRVEYEGVVIFHSSSEKSCTQKQTLFEKLLTRIPESEHVATLMSEGKRALQDSRDCGRAWRSSSTVAELEKVNRQDEKKLCKRKSDYAYEECQVKKIAVLNQKVDRQFHEKAEEGLNGASRNSRKWRLSEEEVRKMAEMTGFSGELDNWKLKRASAASDQVRVKPQPPANPTACRMDRMDWFGSWREETPCEGSGFLDRSQSGQGNPRGETQTVESHQPTPRQLHKCTCVCASRHSHAPSPNSHQKQLDSLPGEENTPVQSPAVVLHHYQATVPAKPSETHVEPPKSTPGVVSHSSQNPLCSNSTTQSTSLDRVQDSMDVDLSRPVSILLLQEENKRLKTENFALRKEIEALHKLVNNASIFGITQDHVNALSEIGKILQSCVRPGSGECDSARATFISDGIQTSPILVGSGTREASGSSPVQPTPRVSVGSGAVDLESNTRPYAQGTQAVSVDSDVEEVNRKAAQQQASPKIVGSGIRKTSGSYHVQPTSQVHVGSGKVDLGSNSRPYAQGTQAVSIDSDVEKVNRKPAQQQASPVIVGSKTRKASGSSPAQPTSQISLGSGTADLDSKSRLSGLGTPAVFVGSDVPVFELSPTVYYGSEEKVLVTPEEDPERYADVLVSSRALSQAEIEAKHSKDYFGTLLNEVIDIVFTQKELCQSRGLGLRVNKKDADEKQPLDQHRVNAVRAYLYAKAKEQMRTMDLSAKTFNTKFQNKIGNARRQQKNKLLQK